MYKNIINKFQKQGISFPSLHTCHFSIIYQGHTDFNTYLQQEITKHENKPSINFNVHNFEHKTRISFSGTRNGEVLKQIHHPWAKNVS